MIPGLISDVKAVCNTSLNSELVTFVNEPGNSAKQTNQKKSRLPAVDLDYITNKKFKIERVGGHTCLTEQEKDHLIEKLFVGSHLPCTPPPKSTLAQTPQVKLFSQLPL
jgi:hypothetical protein